MRALLRLYTTPMVLVVLRIGGALAAFVVSLLMARYMDAAEMGRAMVLMSVAVLGSIFLTLGVEAGAVRYIALYRNADTPQRSRGFFRFVWQVIIVQVIILAVLTLLIHSGGAAFSGGGLEAAFSIALVTSCVMGITRIGAAKAMAFGKVIRSVAPATFLRQIGLLVALAIYVWQVGQPSALTVITIFLLSNAAATVIQFVWNHGIDADIAGAGHDVSQRSVWLRYGCALLPTLLFVQYSRDLTLIFASFGLRASDIAVLGVATAIVNFVKFGVAAINMSIAPKMADMIAAGNHAALDQLVNISNHMKIWPALGCFAVLAVFGDDVLRIFGDQFGNHHAILMILMLEPVALAFFGPSGQYLSLAGHQNVLMYAALAALVAMMVLIGTAAVMIGLQGVAWAVAVCWISWSGGLAYLVRRKSGLNLTFPYTLMRPMKGI